MSKSPLEDIEMYHSNYQQIIMLCAELAELGQKDGSVRNDANVVETINTMINVFGNFSKKQRCSMALKPFKQKWTKPSNLIS